MRHCDPAMLCALLVVAGLFLVPSPAGSAPSPPRRAAGACSALLNSGWFVVVPSRGHQNAKVIGPRSCRQHLPGRLIVHGRVFGELVGFGAGTAATEVVFRPRSEPFFGHVNAAESFVPGVRLSPFSYVDPDGVAAAMGGKAFAAVPELLTSLGANGLGRSPRSLPFPLATRAVIDRHINRAHGEVEHRRECHCSNGNVRSSREAPPGTWLHIRLAEITSRYGVEVRYRYGPGELVKLRHAILEPGLFDSFSQCPSCPLRATQVARHLEAVEQAFARYPPELLRSALRRVYLLGDVWIGLDRIQGTYGKDVIFIVPTTSLYTREILHHELSSVLMHRNKFPWARWRATRKSLNEDLCGAKWRSPLKAAPAHSHGRLARHGLVRAYGCVSLENDFNTYTELMFTDPKKLDRLGFRHPLVSKKLRLACGFYRSLGVDLGDLCLERRQRR